MKQVEQIEMKMISGEVATVRILPEIQISLKDEVKIFNSPSSIQDAIVFLLHLYAQEDYSLRQFSAKISKNKEDENSIAINYVSR